MVEIPKEISDLLKGKKIESLELKVVYKNYRGEIGKRRVIPISVYFGSNEYHKEEQWLMKVFDLDKNDYRDYALKDIMKWGWD